MQTATNQDTGETVALIGGAWKPVEQVATNDKGEKAYLVSGQWMQNKRTAPAQEKPAFEKEAEDIVARGGATPAEFIAGSPITRFAMGAASPFIGGAQLIANAVGKGEGINQSIRQMDEMRQRGQFARGQEGFDVAGLAGSAFSPVGLAALKALPAAGTLLGKTIQGVGLGAASGLSAPVVEEGNFADQKVHQTALGATIGGVIPSAAAGIGKVGRGVYNAAIEPWLDPKSIKGRAFLDAAGDKADEVIALLRGNKQLVQGSAPTAGEAAAPAGRAEFSALQESAAKVRPSDYFARGEEQNAARLAGIREVGQDKAALGVAEVARREAADPLYAAARAGGDIVDANPIVREINSVLSKNPGNRELVNELTEIKRGLLNPDKSVRSNAEEVLSVVDGIKSSMAKEDNKFILGQLDGIKKKIVAAVPGYKQAQQVFAENSAPINQMQVGQYLEKKLVPALAEEGKQRAAMFAEAVRNAPQTLKNSLGQPRFDSLSQALTPEQLNIVGGIQADLARMSRNTELAKKGSQAGANALDLATESMEKAAGGKFPNLLNRGAMIANAVITRMEGKLNAKLAGEIAAEMLNPPAVGETMRRTMLRKAENAALAEAISKGVRGSAFAAGQIVNRDSVPNVQMQRGGASEQPAFQSLSDGLPPNQPQYPVQR